VYKEVIIACPECNAQFIIPREYCGGVVDCSECRTTFEIESLPEDVEVNMKNARSRKKKSKNAGESTNTVAISRNNLGMIPKLDDVAIR
jgi:predicted Zn finger-like uncharacterized protein